MNPRILIVEDNPLNGELLRDWLEVEGYTVFDAASLTAAKAAVERDRPDAVLLDIQLGTEDGLSLVSWMRGRRSLGRIPVIAVTAQAMLPELQRIRESGCSGIVSKPIDFKLLVKQLQLWVPGAKMLQKNS